METVLDALSEGLFLIDETYTIISANTAARELLECDEPTGENIREVLPRSVEATFHESFDTQTLTPETLSFEEYFPQLDSWLRVRTEPTSESGTGTLAVIIEDVSARNRYEQQLETRARELETVTRIITIIESIVEQLTQASGREEIEHYVCEQLVSADLYSAAWIGTPDPVTNELECRSVAGTVGEDLVEAILDGTDESGEGLERQSLVTDEIQVVQPLVECETVSEGVRRIAFAQGVQSGIAVPLAHGGTTYGVLGVYTDRAETLEEDERVAFAALGTAIGYAIHAVKQERLLLSDTVVELTFGVSPRTGFLPHVANEGETNIQLRGVVPLEGAEISVYLEFDQGTPQTVLASTDDASSVNSGRIVRSYDDGGVVELELADTSLLATLAAYGGTVRSAEFDPSGGRVVSEFAPSDDLAAVVETVTREFDGVELAAKRELETRSETVSEFRDDLQERLTDRQRTVLRTSYLADYFESPRGSTAEEVADSLDISSSTLHHHLRAAQRKLLEAFLEDVNSDRSRLRG